MAYQPASAALVRSGFWRRLARRMVRCAACGGRYRLDRIRFVAHKGRAWLYLARCRRCRTLSFIGVVTMTTRTGRAMEETLAALGSAEARPITAEDVSAMRKRLANFDGDFVGLFGQRPDGG